MFLAGSALRMAAVQQGDRALPLVRADRVVGLAHGVFVGQPGDLFGPHGRARLVFLEQGQRFLLERRGIPHDLAWRRRRSGGRPWAARRSRRSAIWASMFLASSIKTPSPSGDRRSSRRL